MRTRTPAGPLLALALLLAPPLAAAGPQDPPLFCMEEVGPQRPVAVCHIACTAAGAPMGVVVVIASVTGTRTGDTVTTTATGTCIVGGFVTVTTLPYPPENTQHDNAHTVAGDDGITCIITANTPTATGWGACWEP